MSAPNPAPYQRPYRPRSVFGPLVLILIGVLFLLHNIGVIVLHSIGWWFAHYWPVLLILWGVVKLFEYLWARQKGYATPHLGGGSVVFLVFFVMFGLLATNSLNWDWPAIHDQIGDDSDWDFGNMWGTNYDFTDSFAQLMSSPQQIRIVNRRGDVTVKASQDGQAHVVVEKSVRSESQSDADRVNESTRAKFGQQGNIWVLDLTGGSFDRGTYNLQLELPPSGDLSVSTRNGDVSVGGQPGNVNLSTEHGDISVEQVKGNAVISLRSGTITAKNVNGNVSLDGGGDVNISDIGGTLTLTGDYPGELQMARVAKPVHFSTSRTDLQFERLDGDLTMDLDSLKATGIGGPFRLDTRSKSVDLEDLSGEVHIEDRNATIQLRPKAPLGALDVSSVHGEIDLTLPAKSSFQLDAQSVGGEIDASDFSLQQNDNGDTAVANGSVGKGGPTIRLRADHGTIQIKKSQ